MEKINWIVDQLELALSQNYDVEGASVINGRSLALAARSRTALQHYAITRKIVVDESRIDDYITVDSEDKPVTEDLLVRRFEWLEKWAEKAVVSDGGHMRSRFFHILLLKSEWLPADFEIIARRFRRTRWFLLGLHGWMDIQLVCYHLDSGKAYSHRTAAEFGRLLERIGKAASL